MAVRLPPLTVSPRTPALRKELTDKQQEFCRLMAKGGNSAQACARLAGYADENHAPQELLANPHVYTRIHKLRSQRIGGDMAALALDTLEDIMKSPANPPAARVSAAKAVLEMAGHGIVAQGMKHRYGLDNENKKLEEMTTEELETFVARQQSALDSLRDVSRSNSPPVYELTDSESTV